MKVLIIGSSGHAKVVIDAIYKAGKNSIAGLIDDFRQAGEVTMGIPVIGKVSDIEKIENIEKHLVFIAVGDNYSREKIFNKISHLNLTYINVIHPSAIIGNEVEIGQGNFIAAGTVISSGTVINDHCIVNTCASVDHDNILESFTSVAPNAALAGNVTLKYGASVGMGALVIEKKTIGKTSVIGAGSVVVKDVEDNVVAYGTPCKPIRNILA